MEDAKQLHIESGEMITITSSRGTITLPSKITERTPPGRVLVAYHFDQLKVNVLTDADHPLTPVSVKKA
jgi:anaerobic selenocysteine-containing dehydrogenase